MRIPPLLSLLLSFALISCGPPNRQDLDLSDFVVEKPSDGIGHYVYAINLPASVAAGGRLDAQMEWRTVGSVDPNSRYAMDVVLDGPGRTEFTVPADANTVGELHLANWLSYNFDVPADLAPGSYQFGVRLRDERRDNGVVPLGYREDLRMGEDGFYRIATVEVTPE